LALALNRSIMASTSSSSAMAITLTPVVAVLSAVARPVGTVDFVKRRLPGGCT
jgi:hypothetical protein